MGEQSHRSKLAEIAAFRAATRVAEWEWTTHPARVTDSCDDPDRSTAAAKPQRSRTGSDDQSLHWTPFGRTPANETPGVPELPFLRTQPSCGAPVRSVLPPLAPESLPAVDTVAGPEPTP